MEKEGVEMENLYILKIFLEPTIILPTILMMIIIFFVMVRIIKKERTESLVYPGISKSHWFTVGGTESKFYYDIDKGASSLEGIQRISNWYVDNIKELKKKKKIDGLAFIEREDGPIGAITKKDLISFMTNISSFVVRPKRRIKASAIKGAENIQGKDIVVISDVATTGYSVEKVIDIIQTCNARVVAAITILNRGGSKTEDLFKEKKIDFIYAADNDDIKNYVS